MRPGQNGELEHFDWITNANGEFHIRRTLPHFCNGSGTMNGDSIIRLPQQTLMIVD